MKTVYLVFVYSVLILNNKVTAPAGLHPARRYHVLSSGTQTRTKTASWEAKGNVPSPLALCCPP